MNEDNVASQIYTNSYDFRTFCMRELGFFVPNDGGGWHGGEPIADFEKGGKHDWSVDIKQK